MKIFKFLTLFFFTLNLSSCLKTTEQIQKEQSVASYQQESQSMLADLVARTKELEEKVNSFQGKVEESQHFQKEGAFQRDTIDELRAEIDAQKRKIEELERTSQEQKKFIKGVTKTLSRISKSLQ